MDSWHQKQQRPRASKYRHTRSSSVASREHNRVSEATVAILAVGEKKIYMFSRCFGARQKKTGFFLSKLPLLIKAFCG